MLIRYIDNGFMIYDDGKCVILNTFEDKTQEEIEVIAERTLNDYIENKSEQQPEPTEEEIMQAEMLLNQMQIIATQQEQDEVLAEILINQMGV